MQEQDCLGNKQDSFSMTVFVLLSYIGLLEYLETSMNRSRGSKMFIRYFRMCLKCSLSNNLVGLHGLLVWKFLVKFAHMWL